MKTMLKGPDHDKICIMQGKDNSLGHTHFNCPLPMSRSKQTLSTCHAPTDNKVLGPVHHTLDTVGKGSSMCWLCNKCVSSQLLSLYCYRCNICTNLKHDPYGVFRYGVLRWWRRGGGGGGDGGSGRGGGREGGDRQNHQPIPEKEDQCD